MNNHVDSAIRCRRNCSVWKLTCINLWAAHLRHMKTYTTPDYSPLHQQLLRDSECVCSEHKLHKINTHELVWISTTKKEDLQLRPWPWRWAESLSGCTPRLALRAFPGQYQRVSRRVLKSVFFVFSRMYQTQITRQSLVRHATTFASSLMSGVEILSKIIPTKGTHKQTA